MSFPFSFFIPHDAPASFQYSWTNKKTQKPCFGSIEYKIQAFIPFGEPGTKKYLSFKNALISTHLNIFVDHPAKVELGYRKTENVNHIKCCCCIPKGDVGLVAHFEKINYTQGETAYVVAEVDNTNSKVDILSISGYFKQILTFRANGQTKIVARKLTRVEHQGIRKGQKMVGPNAQRIPIELLDKDRCLPVQPKTVGKLVENSYTILVKAKVDTTLCCCDRHPESELKLEICNQVVEKSMFFEEIQNKWDPQIMEHISAQIANIVNVDKIQFKQKGIVPYQTPYSNNNKEIELSLLSNPNDKSQPLLGQPYTKPFNH